MAIRDFLPTAWRGNTDMSAKQEAQNPFFQLQREINRMFDDFFIRVDFPAPGDFLDDSEFSPSIDIIENERDVIIKAELPGMNEEDIEVFLTDDAITIAGGKKEEKVAKEKAYYYTERSYGSFRRVLPLPGGIDSQNAHATFKKGVLIISVPKIEMAAKKVKKIAIRSE